MGAVAHPGRVSRGKALAELQALSRAAGRPLPSYEIPPPLYEALLHHFGGIHRARRVAGLPDPPWPRRWSEEAVIAEVRRVHRSGVVIRYRDLIDADREDLAGAIRVYLAGIARARRMARLPHPPRRNFETDSWDEDRVIEEIQTRAEAGEPLAHSKAPTALVNAGMRYFGSWAAAIAAADLDYDAIRLRRAPFDDEGMLERIRELAAEHPDMTLGELHDLPEGQAIMRRFGSLEIAAERAGLASWPRRRNHAPLNAEDVLARLRSRKRARRRLTKTAIGSDDARLWNSIQRHFGTLRAALTAAGLGTEIQRHEWSEAEVLRYLKERQDQGLPVTSLAVQREAKGLYQAVLRYFGSYEVVLRRLGVEPLQRGPWSADEVITELRRLAKGKAALGSADIPNGLLHACARQFGSFVNAREAAGIPAVPRKGGRRPPPRVPAGTETA